MKSAATKVVAALACVAAVVAVSACGNDKKEQTLSTPEAAVVLISDSNNNSTQTLHVGDVLQVDLDTAGGSGYTWKVTTDPDAAVVKYVSQSQEKKATTTSAGAAPMTGTPEVVSTKFKAVGEGSTKIVLGHVGPTGGAPADTFTVTVTVSK